MVGNRAQQEAYSETRWSCGVLSPIASMYVIFAYTFTIKRYKKQPNVGRNTKIHRWYGLWLWLIILQNKQDIMYSHSGVQS